MTMQYKTRIVIGVLALLALAAAAFTLLPKGDGPALADLDPGVQPPQGETSAKTALADQIPSRHPAAGHRNIFLIVLDTVRWDVLNLEDRQNTIAPNLAALTDDGVLFANTYSTACWTIPSHFSMFTGFTEQIEELDVADNAISAQLPQVGYATRAASANPMLDSRRSFIEAFEEFRHVFRESIDRIPHEPELWERIRRVLDYYNAPFHDLTAGQLIADAARMREVTMEMLSEVGDRPFFYFLNLMDAHDPYFPNPDYFPGWQTPFVWDFYADLRTRFIHPWSTYVDDEEQLAEIERIFETYCRGRRWSLAVDLTEVHLQLYHQLYRACIRDLDRDLGRLMDDLKQNGLYDSSVFIIVSDHGEEIGETGFMTHLLDGAGDYEILHRVPLVIIAPETHGRGRVVREEVSVADIAPTILELAGIEADGTVANLFDDVEYGRSLLPFLGIEPAPVRHRVTLRVTDATAEEIAEMDAELEAQMRAVGYIQ